ACLLYYNSIVYNAYNKAPKDYLPINLRAALLKVNKYYTKLNNLLAYYTAIILYLYYKHYYN
ncbi:uncharacterized protein BDR25DRAFT_206658, partial [Lindgomyces ingoldianus]